MTLKLNVENLSVNDFTTDQISRGIQICLLAIVGLTVSDSGMRQLSDVKGFYKWKMRSLNTASHLGPWKQRRKCFSSGCQILQAAIKI